MTLREFLLASGIPQHGLPEAPSDRVRAALQYHVLTGALILGVPLDQVVLLLGPGGISAVTATNDAGCIPPFVLGTLRAWADGQFIFPDGLGGAETMEEARAKFHDIVWPETPMPGIGPNGTL